MYLLLVRGLIAFENADQFKHLTLILNNEYS